jgi:hypothetical protein
MKTTTMAGGNSGLVLLRKAQVIISRNFAPFSFQIAAISQFSAIKACVKKN